ncbi:MAG: hypothetical protein ACRD29_06715 [Acidimicrobiales bacterium]
MRLPSGAVRGTPRTRRRRGTRPRTRPTCGGSRPHRRVGTRPQDIAVTVAKQVALYPDITGVHYAPEGGAEFLVIVGLRQRYVNQAKNLLLSALGSIAHPKMVIVVDDDIDIYDPTEVWWSVLTRAQPADDVIIIPKAAGGQLDPSAPSKFGSSLMGIDATRPFGEPFPEVVAIPGVEDVPDWTGWLRTKLPPST